MSMAHGPSQAETDAGDPEAAFGDNRRTPREYQPPPLLPTPVASDQRHRTGHAAAARIAAGHQADLSTVVAVMSDTDRVAGAP